MQGGKEWTTNVPTNTWQYGTPKIAICDSDHHMLFSDFKGKATWKDTKLLPSSRTLYSKISSIPLEAKKTEDAQIIFELKTHKTGPALEEDEQYKTLQEFRNHFNNNQDQHMQNM